MGDRQVGKLFLFAFSFCLRPMKESLQFDGQRPQRKGNGILINVEEIDVPVQWEAWGALILVDAYGSDLMPPVG